ncbi:MAG: hypothetical protein ACF8QF_01025 [Phycisphaerales bacterium]
MAESPANRMRWMLRALLALGILGIGAELLLTEHTEMATQWIPIVAMGIGMLALGLDVFSRGRLATVVMRLSMLALVGVGALGLWYHYESNVEFQRELDADGTAWEHFVASMRATSPPSLAPGAMALLGGIGLISTCGAGAARRTMQEGAG